VAVHKTIERSGIYFITFTCYKWLRLIELTKAYDEVYKFFGILNQKGHPVLGYVIMPNHLHLLLYFEEKNQSLNTIIGNGKRFIGYEIVRRLKNQGKESMLAILSEGVDPAARQRNKQHQIWQGTFDIKECRTEAFILQKLNYMHFNPCTEHWKLSEKPYDYEHSSAAFYERGKQGKFEVRDYLEFMAVLLENEERERNDITHDESTG